MLRAQLAMVAGERAEHGEAPGPWAALLLARGRPDLPGAHATMALRAGVNPRAVSARRGHASVAVTPQTRTDAVPELDHDEAERVASLFLTAGLDLPGR